MYDAMLCRNLLIYFSEEAFSAAYRAVRAAAWRPAATCSWGTPSRCSTGRPPSRPRCWAAPWSTGSWRRRDPRVSGRRLRVRAARADPGAGARTGLPGGRGGGQWRRGARQDPGRRSRSGDARCRDARHGRAAGAAGAAALEAHAQGADAVRPHARRRRRDGGGAGRGSGGLHRQNHVQRDGPGVSPARGGGPAEGARAGARIGPAACEGAAGGAAGPDMGGARAVRALRHRRVHRRSGSGAAHPAGAAGHVPDPAGDRAAHAGGVHGAVRAAARLVEPGTRGGGGGRHAARPRHGADRAGGTASARLAQPGGRADGGARRRQAHSERGRDDAQRRALAARQGARDPADRDGGGRRRRDDDHPRRGRGDDRGERIELRGVRDAAGRGTTGRGRRVLPLPEIAELLARLGRPDGQAVPSPTEASIQRK